LCGLLVYLSVLQPFDRKLKFDLYVRVCLGFVKIWNLFVI
jgi:hypothetical protein